MARGFKVLAAYLGGVAVALVVTAACNGARAMQFKIVSAFKFMDGRDHTDGAYPVGPLISGGGGNLYGTTRFGGANLTQGTVFELEPDGTETVLHTFRAQSGGAPNGPLYIEKAGNLFGTMAGTSGTVGNAAHLWAGAIFEIEAR